MGDRRDVVVDPAVMAILGEGDRRAEERRLPAAQRAQRARDRKRIKLTADLTRWPWLADEVSRLAESEDAGLSSTMAWLLTLGLAAAAERDPRKEHAKSLKYSYEMVVERGSGR